MKLYESTGMFAELFDLFDTISEAEPDRNEAGDYIDNDGTVIPDLSAWRYEQQEAWLDTLTGLEAEFEEKAGHVAAYIKGLKAESEAIKDEEDRLKARRRSKENQIARLKDYLLTCMTGIGRKKIETTRAVISVRNNAESVCFDDPGQFVKLCQERDLDGLLRYHEPEIDKTAVRKALQNGDDLPGCRLIRTQSLIIK